MANKPATINDILEAKLCLGCAACAYSVAGKIEMAIDRAGYLRPHVSSVLSSPEEAAAIKVCPGIDVSYPTGDPSYHDLWGPLVASRVGWSTDESLRYRASSGGGISALASYLLENGKVDAVLHIGVSDSDPLRNVFRISRTAEDIATNAGSRYAPAAPIEGLRKAISQFARIGFIGKPCDIVAVRKLASADPIVAERVTTCLSFMCAGVPSIKGTHAVIEHLGVGLADVVQFRYRGNGWPGLATAQTMDGESRSMTYDESWGRILNRHLQFRCKICVDGTGEFADVTCADAWYGTADGYPDFEERQGRSLMLSRTEKGEALINAALAARYLEVETLPVPEIEKMQPYQAARKRMVLSRILALKLFGRRAPRYDVSLLWRLARGAGLMANLRSFLGMARRLGARR